MTIEFKFNSNCGESFTVVNFHGTEGISQLYQYEIELKAPLSRAIELDDVLDETATFILKQDGDEFPIHGILASFDEMQTVQGYVHYKAVLVPTLWKLSNYKTNEIYTTEKTVDMIIQTVLENAGMSSGTDFELGLLNTSDFLQRDYVCQFGESDFDFISRLMENEGVFYYFDHSGSNEKIVFINDGNYVSIDNPDLIYETDNSKANQKRQITSWICRKKRLPENISLRDYNSSQPSLDISHTMSVDAMGSGTEYLYGSHIKNSDEATCLTALRAEQMQCNKTRYYAASSVVRLQAGYTFALDKHPNTKNNDKEYLLVEVTHEGSHLDMAVLGESSEHQSTYHNSFVAIDSLTQFRPPLMTVKPRFYGTMTAFIYAETGSSKPEVNEFGEYRVHLPFDRADATVSSDDPDRKASAWMRMAQPYVGQDQGMYFPLTGGTEVLLTFINGDPDQPVISAAIPNAAQPSLMENNPEWASSVTALTSQQISGNTHRISTNGSAISANAATIDDNSDRIAELEGPPAVIPAGPNTHFINDGTVNLTNNMIPPWTGIAITKDPKNPSPVYDESLIKFKTYDKDLNATDMVAADLEKVSTDRSAGDNYVYANARTFAYPQHERVYFIGTFHEDFHVKDDFLTAGTPGTGAGSWTGECEQFHFPAPGGDATSSQTKSTKESDINPSGIRGVSEDKRWGNQMFYAWGRSFNWSGGEGEGGSFECINYGNGTTEDLIRSSGGRFSDIPLSRRPNWDMYKEKAKVAAPDRPAGTVPNPYTPNNYEKKFVNGGKALAAYTFVDGNTYSYQSGDDLDVNDGASDSWTFGDSKDWCFGHSCSWVNGDSVSYTLGSSTDLLFGNSNSVAIGLTTDTFVGGQIETCVAAKAVFELSITTGINAAKDTRADLFEDKVTAKSNKALIDDMTSSVKELKNTVDSKLNGVKISIIAVADLTLGAGGNVKINTLGMAMVNGSIIKVG